jgi:hypothetical protein
MGVTNSADVFFCCADELLIDDEIKSEFFFRKRAAYFGNKVAVST